MPNDVKNVLTFSGSQFAINELFKDIEDKVEDEHTDIDFNKIIPMPESLHIEEGGRKDLAIELFMANGIKREKLCYDKNLSADDANELIELGSKYCYNKVTYGYSTWYDWSIYNWGTKWNAYDTERADNMLIFQTAWSTPIPIIQKLSEMFPTITIDHKFADEDIGNNCGNYIWQSGEIISRVDMDDNEAKKFALDLWEWEEE